MRPDDPALSMVVDADALRELELRPAAPVFDVNQCYGAIGDYVRLWAPHTEAAPVAIYACALAAIGALFGRGPTWKFGNESHHARFFVLLIGVSGAGRKGTAINIGVNELLGAVDEDFARTRKVSGLSSAEGFIAELRDPTPPKISLEGKPLAPGDEGVTDKRILVVEGEIAGAFEAMGREGNRLSAIVRDAWDGKDLRSLVKRDPQRATAPHANIVGAITGPELRKLFKQTSVGNGFANRFLAIWSTRARLLPEDSAPDATSLAAVHRDIALRVDRARTVGRVQWSDSARLKWARVYRQQLAVPNDPSDTIRVLLERGAPYVRRIAFLLALMDGGGTVDVPHLNAALALWQYVADTWRYVYNDGAKRSVLAEKVLAALLDAGAAGLTRTQIREDVVRSGDVPGERIALSLSELASGGMAERLMVPTGGRPREVWRHACFVGEVKEERDLREETTHFEEDCSLSYLPSFPSGDAEDYYDIGHGASFNDRVGPAFDDVPWPDDDRNAA